MELKDFLKIIRKRLWLLAAFVCVCCTVSGIYSYYYAVPIYEASTKLIVNQSSEDFGLTGINLNEVNTNIQLIATYKEIIKTPAIMGKVVEQYPELQLNADELIGKVRVNSVNDTQVMTLIVSDPSYRRAAQIVNAVSRVFLKEIPEIMKVDNVTILNEADADDGAPSVSPHRKMNVAITFVVSSMLILSVIFLLEYLDDTVKSEEDVRNHLGLPTLAMISKMKKAETSPKPASPKKQKAGEAQYVSIHQ